MSKHSRLEEMKKIGLKRIEQNKRKIKERIKSWFFEKIKNTDKSLAKSTNRKRKKIHINKLGVKRGITKDIKEILYSIKREDLKGMNEFLKAYDLSTFNQDEANNLRRASKTTKKAAVI